MRAITVCILALLVAISAVTNVHAQASESIWLTANNIAYKTGETVTVTVNATSATPIQGFTFQISYDPACLKPVNAASTIPGMTGLSLPQISGLVDASYASTTPQTVNGVLAEVRFISLGGCQTNLILQSAALAIRNESGFAAPLAGVTISANNVALNIDKAVGVPQPTEPVAGSILALDPPVDEQGISGWFIALLAILLAIGVSLGAFRLFRRGRTATRNMSASSSTPTLEIKHGPNAGKSFMLKQLPCSIGRDLKNEICINDPHVMGQHARIFATNNDYYLMDLSGNTFINGQAVRNSSVVLKSGDVVRLGKSALFVFAV